MWIFIAKMMTYWQLIAFFVTNVDSARILGIFPVNPKSHMMFNQAVMKALADAGHHITIISLFTPSLHFDNATVISLRSQNVKKIDPWSQYDFKTMSTFSEIKVAADIAEKECYDFMKSENVQNFLRSAKGKYDVMILELFVFYECYLPLAERLDLPLIGIFTTRSPIRVEIDYAVGNPCPIPMPFVLSSSTKTETFYHRLRNAVVRLIYEIGLGHYQRSRIDKFYEQYFPTYDSSKPKELSSLFTNGHPNILPRPLSPTVIEVGGIHLKYTSKPLPQNIKTFIDSAPYGVILLSFGSFTGSSVVTDKLIRIFRDVFAQLPQKVIWKYDTKVEDMSDNVLILPWIPQRDILAHEKVVAFVSHCGLFGTYEAIDAGKPMVLVPIFADQPANAALMEDFGVGFYVDISTITKDGLLKAISSVINDKRYGERMRQLSYQFKDQMVSPQEKVVYWTEYVIRHNGTKHLKPITANMPLYQYFSIDVMVFLGSVLFFFIAALYCLVRKFAFFRQKKYGSRVLQKKNE